MSHRPDKKIIIVLMFEMCCLCGTPLMLCWALFLILVDISASMRGTRSWMRLLVFSQCVWREGVYYEREEGECVYIMLGFSA